MEKTPKTFEIGLVMAGAVSAGAYTAGVVDFLIEALDTWDQARTAQTKGTPTSRWHDRGHRLVRTTHQAIYAGWQRASGSEIAVIQGMG